MEWMANTIYLKKNGASKYKMESIVHANLGSSRSRSNMAGNNQIKHVERDCICFYLIDLGAFWFLYMMSSLLSMQCM
jgi:hypothetical protein